MNICTKFSEFMTKYGKARPFIYCIKGPSINVNIFTSVQIIHFQGKGGGAVKIKKNSVHF